MHYSEQEAKEEIFRRGSHIRKKREKRKNWILSGVTGALSLLLIFLITAAPHSTLASSQPSAMGAFLLKAESGVLVLVAVIAFSLGVLVTMLCLRHRNRQSAEKKAASRQETETVQTNPDQKRRNTL